jgi:DHA1 family tetracycline resistance protein-like MFS transporter
VSPSKKTSPLLPIFFIVAVDVLGLTLILPFLPFYAESFGAKPWVVGLLISSYAFFQLVSAPILGDWSDRFGRRKVLILSQIGTLIGFLILGQAKVLWVVFLSRMIDGATAGNLSVAQAYIADVTPQEKRAKAFGIIGVAFGMGFLVGPAISGFLAGYDFHYPIYFAALLSFVSILLTYFTLPEPDFHVRAKEIQKVSIFDWSKYTHQFKRKNVGTTLYLFLCFHLAFSLFFSGFPLFLERRFNINGIPFGPKEVGYLYAYSGLMGAVIQGGMIGKLVDRFGEVKIVIVSFLLLALGYFALSVSFHLPLLLISATLSAWGHGMVRPALTSILSRQVSSTEQGTVLGLSQSLNSVSQIIAPIIGGILIGRGFLTLWGSLSALISLVGLGLILKAKQNGNYRGGFDHRGETQSPIP